MYRITFITACLLIVGCAGEPDAKTVQDSPSYIEQRLAKIDTEKKPILESNLKGVANAKPGKASTPSDKSPDENEIERKPSKIEIQFKKAFFEHCRTPDHRTGEEYHFVELKTFKIHRQLKDEDEQIINVRGVALGSGNRQYTYGSLASIDSLGICRIRSAGINNKRHIIKGQASWHGN